MMFSYGELFRKWEREGILQEGRKANVEKYNQHHLGPGHGGGQFTTADSQSNGLPAGTPKDALSIKKQKFVDAHLAAAEKVAQSLNIPVENILGLSAYESGWNKAGSFADRGNNFFGLYYPAPFMINPPMIAADSGNKMARFASYDDSAQSFAARYGNIIQGISDPTAFASRLQNSGAFGINPDDGSKVPAYVSELSATIKGLRASIARARGS